MLAYSIRFTVYCVLCYFYVSGVGVEFIRPETGLINQTPTLIQRQVCLSPVFTGGRLCENGNLSFLFSGTFGHGHDASYPYILYITIFLTRYEMRISLLLILPLFNILVNQCIRIILPLAFTFSLLNTRYAILDTFFFFPLYFFIKCTTIKKILYLIFFYVIIKMSLNKIKK